MLKKHSRSKKYSIKKGRQKESNHLTLKLVILYITTDEKYVKEGWKNGAMLDRTIQVLKHILIDNSWFNFVLQEIWTNMNSFLLPVLQYY